MSYLDLKLWSEIGLNELIYRNNINLNWTILSWINKLEFKMKLGLKLAFKPGIDPRVGPGLGLY